MANLGGQHAAAGTVTEAVRNRRSTRKFLPKPVAPQVWAALHFLLCFPPLSFTVSLSLAVGGPLYPCHGHCQLVNELLELAFRAPSGGNTQPWHV